MPKQPSKDEALMLLKEKVRQATAKLREALRILEKE